MWTFFCSTMVFGRLSSSKKPRLFFLTVCAQPCFFHDWYQLTILHGHTGLGILLNHAEANKSMIDPTSLFFGLSFCALCDFLMSIMFFSWLTMLAQARLGKKIQKRKRSAMFFSWLIALCEIRTWKKKREFFLGLNHTFWVDDHGRIPRRVGSWAHKKRGVLECNN